MRISEVFYSLQGEGAWAGCPMVFVRLQGCPFRCRWCDSAYTLDFEGGDEMALPDVLRKVAEYRCKMVCITGGEPLARPRDFEALVTALKAGGYWMEVETSGGYKLPWQLPIDSWVMDMKCPASGMERFNKYEEIPSLRSQDQLKFVVAGREDFDFALSVVEKHKPACQVLFTPAWGELPPATLAEWVKAESPAARVSLQLHKYIWEPNKRGV